MDKNELCKKVSAGMLLVTMSLYATPVFAGHSHNGQINIPYIKKLLLPEGSKKYYNNYYKVNNTNLYISSGLGESNINFRLFNKPSINFYRINKIGTK